MMTHVILLPWTIWLVWQYTLLLGPIFTSERVQILYYWWSYRPCTKNRSGRELLDECWALLTSQATSYTIPQHMYTCYISLIVENTLLWIILTDSCNISLQEHFFTPETYGNIIYEHFLFAIPKLRTCVHCTGEQTRLCWERWWETCLRDSLNTKMTCRHASRAYWWWVWVEIQWHWVTELHWVTLGYIELIELRWVELYWVTLSWLSYVELNYIELHWVTQLHCIIPLRYITLCYTEPHSYTELHWATQLHVYWATLSYTVTWNYTELCCPWVES